MGGYGVAFLSSREQSGNEVTHAWLTSSPGQIHGRFRGIQQAASRCECECGLIVVVDEISW